MSVAERNQSHDKGYYNNNINNSDHIPKQNYIAFIVYKNWIVHKFVQEYINYLYLYIYIYKVYTI